MPAVSCPGCSASLKVPDGLAGKKAKCRKCNTFFQIPAVSAVTAGPPPISAGPPPIPAGHRAGPGGQQLSNRPMPPRRPAPVYEEDDDDDERPRRRRRGKRRKEQSSPVMMVSLICAGAVLFIGLAVGGVFLAMTGGSSNDTKPGATLVAQPNNDPLEGGAILPADGAGVPAGEVKLSGLLTADLKYMPANADMLLGVNISEIMNSQSLTDVLQVFPELQMLSQNNLDPTNKLQVMAADFGSLLVGGDMDKGMKGKGMVLVAQINNPQSLDQIIEKVAAESKSITIGTHTVYQNPNGKEGMARVAPNKIVYGEMNVLATVLVADKAPVFSREIQQGLSDINAGDTMFVLLNGKKLPKNNAAIAGIGNPDDGPPPQTIVMSAKVARDVSLKLVAHFADPQEAMLVKEKLDQGLQDAKKNAGALGAELGNLLDSIQGEIDGSKVAVSLRFEAGPVAKMAKGFAANFGGFGGNPFAPKGGNPFGPEGAGGFVPPNPADPFPDNGVDPADPFVPKAVPNQAAFPGDPAFPGVNPNPNINPNPGFPNNPMPIPGNAPGFPNNGFQPGVANPGNFPNAGNLPGGFDPNNNFPNNNFPNNNFPNNFPNNNFPNNNFPIVPQVPNIPNNNFPNNNFPNINNGLKNQPKAPAIGGGAVPRNSVIGGGGGLKKTGFGGIGGVGNPQMPALPTNPINGKTGIGGNVPNFPNAGIGNTNSGIGGFGGKTGFPMKGPFGK
jgi:hypothetical protein